MKNECVWRIQRRQPEIRKRPTHIHAASSLPIGSAVSTDTIAENGQVCILLAETLHEEGRRSTLLGCSFRCKGVGIDISRVARYSCCDHVVDVPYQSNSVTLLHDEITEATLQSQGGKGGACERSRTRKYRERHRISGFRPAHSSCKQRGVRIAGAVQGFSILYVCMKSRLVGWLRFHHVNS